MTLPFSAVFFDMDGTFVNTEPHWLIAETELMAQFGHPWTVADQQFCLGGPLTKVGKYMWELAGQKESPDYFHHELVRRTIAHFDSGIEFMPGALELLLELKSHNVPVGLVTASPAPLLSATLQSLDEQYFDVTVSSADVKKVKPDPEGYILAANRIGVDINDTLILEDSLTGIAAGIASGAAVIAIPHIVEVPEQGRVRVISSLEGMTVDSLINLYVPKDQEAGV
jgi:HAD superfamily hydrolase (TIGR01509 family)